MAGQSSYKDKENQMETPKTQAKSEMETRNVIPIWGISPNMVQHSGLGVIVKNT